MLSRNDDDRLDVKLEWILAYDPYAHSSDDELLAEAYPEGGKWDFYNLRETALADGFHAGMVFYHQRLGSVVETVLRGTKVALARAAKEVKIYVAVRKETGREQQDDFPITTLPHGRIVLEREDPPTNNGGL